MKLNKEIEIIIENQDFVLSNVNVQNQGYYVEISQYTPAGQDWNFVIWFDKTDKDFLNNFYEYVDGFDIDEEASWLIQSRGSFGIPSSIQDILEDQMWKKETLENLKKELKTLNI